MFLLPCETRCDEALAFPARLRPAIHSAVVRLANSESDPPRHVFAVRVDQQILRIPYRLYYDLDVLRRELDAAHGDTRLILACLGTRHHDGHLRQACLPRLFESDEAWLTPYLLQLASEYVVEIVRDIAIGIGRRDKAALATFALDNPAYLATLERRVCSYWSYYHRAAYPDRMDYPGSKVLAVLRAACPASGS